MTRARRSIGRVFAWPASIALVTLAALAIGLLGDGWQDVAAGIGLAVPVAIALHFSVRRGKRAS